MPLKVYADLTHYNPKYRYHLNSITKALANDRSQEEREKNYGALVRLFQLVGSPSQADVVLLAYKWSHYVNRGHIAQAEQAAQGAQSASKPFIVFCAGDFPARLPFDNALLFETAGYRSALGYVYHSGQPIFLPDYRQLYCQNGWQPRPKTARPVVGFCGLAGGSALQLLSRRAANLGQRLSYRLGWRKWEPPPFETSSFRQRVLGQFASSPGIDTNFILRKKYRAGVSGEKDPHHPSRLEFVGNILNTDYTVCMRGGGNFSVRFCETLSLGRIPLFIDTDCLLPWHDQLDYKAHFPWIEMHELPHAAEKLLDFHHSLTDSGFIDLQHACRKLWEEQFTADGFYTRLAAQDFHV